MSGDLEEFLRRAAQRRRERAAQHQAQQPKPRPRPEYTDRRAERAATAQYDQATEDAPLIAEVVDKEDVAETIAQVRSAVQSQSRQPAPSRQSDVSPQKTSPQKPAPAAVQIADEVASLPQAEVTPEELMAWLRNPAGLKQAILIREILDRPTHRWE